MGSRHSKLRTNGDFKNAHPVATSRSSRRAGKRAEKIQQSPRSVVLITWGRNGQSSWSFHKCILIANTEINQVTEETIGTHWDWGSIVGGVKITVNPPVQQKKFLEEDIFKKGEKYGNTYHIVGTTNWSDDKIKELYTRIGEHYNVITNNCRDVAAGVARSLTIDTARMTVAEAMLREWDIKRNKVRISVPFAIAGAPLWMLTEEQMRGRPTISQRYAQG
ncbi:hypothetical protein PFICI_12317 [Pestalotiopsis fici W106-1]|uniref:Uncharacterized protein n=1 Tax=Pestalotiopsis fici (strain W106-1 / CGMCC3.15140) TaxID=1229662 RepID=W3WNE0_PESFW|nr:uncharacterized protein PFICI_12317 [Pestalotiopsis fici W106-1]ETS75373.1 hypothetical protein PFICI_12317 [Pestalotiopsis fici W106-1]